MNMFAKGTETVIKVSTLNPLRNSKTPGYCFSTEIPMGFVDSVFQTTTYLTISEALDLAFELKSNQPTKQKTI